MERFIGFFEGVRMTIISGIALVISLVLRLTHTEFIIDPAWISVIISGIPLLYAALYRLFGEKRITSALLITIAMIACICIDEVFAAGEVAFIMALGELLEDYTVNRAKRGLGKLIALAPEMGRRIIFTDGKETEQMIPAEEIRVGDIIRVLPGEHIAVDGTIVKGTTTIDQSVMTGESLPVDKRQGEDVFCGTVNCHGAIDIRATKVGEDSSLQKMIQLVKEAENNKAPMQRIVDQWASLLVPISLSIAIITYLCTADITRAITVLVVFCPCALALATPVSIIAGIGQATKFGILIKSGEALEQMGKVDCITFDKTGTLTLGNLNVCDIRPFGNCTAEELLRYTALAESYSEHPIGKAIWRHYLSNEGVAAAVESFQMVPGKGVAAAVDGRRVLCGKADYLAEQGVVVGSDVTEELNQMRDQGKAAVVTAVDGVCVGVLSLADNLRATAQTMVGELTQMGVTPVMLTGDNERAARFLADKVGIAEVRAELLPADKVAAIQTLQSQGKVVCMIGDGVNDAPALKVASVGVAMGSMGSDIAIESADMALMGDDIAKIPYLKRLSRAVVRSIKLNISISMVINTIAITLSILGILGPGSGALVHNAGSVLVVLNAALLYDRKV